MLQHTRGAVQVKPSCLSGCLCSCSCPAAQAECLRPPPQSLRGLPARGCKPLVWPRLHCRNARWKHVVKQFLAAFCLGKHPSVLEAKGCQTCECCQSLGNTHKPRHSNAAQPRSNWGTLRIRLATARVHVFCDSSPASGVPAPLESSWPTGTKTRVFSRHCGSKASQPTTWGMPRIPKPWHKFQAPNRVL